MGVRTKLRAHSCNDSTWRPENLPWPPYNEPTANRGTYLARSCFRLFSLALSFFNEFVFLAHLQSADSGVGRGCHLLRLRIRVALVANRWALYTGSALEKKLSSLQMVFPALFWVPKQGQNCLNFLFFRDRQNPPRKSTCWKLPTHPTQSFRSWNGTWSSWSLSCEHPAPKRPPWRQYAADM